MSGHNKWSKIKNKKAATDAQKSKTFGKLVRLIQSEAKKSNGDTSSPGLRSAIEKARKENMPSDNIDRVIKRASEGSADVTDVMFEIYAPGGVGMIVTGLTDNNNRTSAEIKHLLSQHNAVLGGKGSVSWNFERNNETGEWLPKTYVDINETDGEKLEKLIELIEDNDDVQDVYVNAQ